MDQNSQNASLNNIPFEIPSCLTNSTISLFELSSLFDHNTEEWTEKDRDVFNRASNAIKGIGHISDALVYFQEKMNARNIPISTELLTSIKKAGKELMLVVR